MPINLDNVDLGSFGVDADTNRVVRSNMDEAFKTNPDEFARNKKLSQESGMPQFAVQSDPADVENNLKLENINFGSLSRETPATSNFLTTFDNAVVAQDDIDGMVFMENVLKSINPANIIPDKESFDLEKAFRNIGPSIGLSFKGQSLGLRAAGADITPERIDDLIPASALPMGMEFQAADLSRTLAKNLGIETDEQLQEAKENSVTRLMGELRELQAERKALTPEDLNTVEQGVRGGIESLANMAPGFALMLGTGGRAAPLLLTMGVQTYGDSYGDARAEGLSPEMANWKASIDAGIEVGTEILPTGTLSRMLTGGAKGDMTKAAMKFIVQEMGTEQLATLGQTINDFAFGLDEQLENATSAEEVIRIQLQRQAVTAIATVVAGGTQVAAVTTVRKTIEAIGQQEKQVVTRSEAEQQSIDQINETATDSKLRERDSESFKQFIQEADGDGNTSIFIDGAQASLYLQTKTQEEIAEDPALQLIADQVREAAALGGEVVIPVADFATDVAGTEHFDALRDSMTMSGETVPPFRQEQVQQETQNYIQGLMAEAEENASSFVEAQEIFTSVRDQLVDTGTVNAQNASTMAQIVPAWATVYAKQNGISVQEAYQASGLVVEGPQTGELARLSEEALAQGAIDFQSQLTAEFPNVNLSLSGKGNRATLNKIIVPEDQRETGVGTQVVQRIIDWADSNGVTVALTPSADFGGTKKRLTAFYKRFGFVENKGRNKDFEISETMFREPQQPELLAQEEIADETTRQELERDRGQREAQQAVIEETKARDDKQALAEFERAKAGEKVTFTHRAHGIRETFDDTKLGANTITPSAFLGHYLSAADVGNVERYGPDLNVYEVILNNPLVISPEVFESATADLTPEEAAARRVSFMEMGHDGILVEGLNWMIVFEGNTVQHLEEDVEGLLFGQRRPGAPEARGFYDPANTTIRLTEAADLSTFLHEFAHFMLEMERNTNGDTLKSIDNWHRRNADSLAKEAQQENKDVTADDVLVYLDNNRSSGDKSKDRAINMAIHEQFARGFETYLMEGKSPSIELRNAFRQFARWLTRIYTAMRGDLKVDLDVEMRAVYDRMLATEEQIAAAEARARFEPMFTDAAMAGMTEAEFTEYQKRQEKVKDKQTETLREKLIKELTRVNENQWKEEKQDIVDEELVKLSTERVHVARERLRTGETKLDLAATKAMVGEEKIDKLGRKSIRVPSSMNKMTVAGGAGVHPDQAAAFLGYNSGSELLDDLTTAPKIQDQAESNAEAEMIDRHGDIMNDGTIEAQADEAVQNEERGRLILQELKILSRGTSQPAIDRGIMKALAEDRIGKLSFREIHPGKYRKAEIKAAQESAAALVTGDKETASRAKARQAMNYYLGLAATDARTNTVKIVDTMGRYNKKKVREEIMKAGNEYWEQIAKILDRFEFRKTATLRQVEQVNTDINTWMNNRVDEHGDGLILTPAVTNEAYVTHWKNVPFSDLQGINDSVKNIEHVARYTNKINLLEEKVDFKKMVSNWVDHMNKQKSVFTPQRITTVKNRDWIRAGMAQMTKIPFMASWLDGGERVGLSHDLLMTPLNVAYKQEQDLWKEVGDVVMNTIEGRSKDDRARHMRTVFIPEIKDADNDGNLQGGQILAVALNTGNAGNLRKMLLGEGWADPDLENTISIQNPQLQAVLKHMTKSDWELVQLVWTQMDKLYPQLAEVHRKTTGLTAPKVEAVPVETQFGTFEGGYYPVVYDRFRSARAAANQDRADAQVESMFGGTMNLQAAINVGSTNERTGFYGPINLNLDVVPNHFQETIHYITHHDAVRQINKLINDSAVRETITAKLGPEEYSQLKPWLNDVAKDGKNAPPKSFIDAAFGRLRMGVTLGIMGFKASTGLIQISGIFNTYAEIGSTHVHKAMRTVYGRGISSIKDAQQFAFEHSNIMETRTKTMDREIKNAMDRLKGKRGILPAVQEASMKHIAYIQFYGADILTWHAGYTSKLEEAGDVERAYRYADWAVENIQGSGLTKDMATVFRNQSKTHTTFTMFMTFFSSLWNMERDLARGARSGKYSLTSLTAKVMFMFFLPVLFESMMRGELDDEDDALLQKTLTKLALYPTASIPFVRDIASGVGSSYGYNSSPVASTIEQGLQGIVGLTDSLLTDDDIRKSSVKATTKLVGAALQFPGVSQAWATGEHIYDVVEEGEELSVHQLLFGPKKD